MGPVAVYASLFAGITATCFNRLLGKQGICIFLVTSLIVSLFCIAYPLYRFIFFYEIWEYSLITPWLGTAVVARSSWVSWFDTICALMLFTVLLVSLLVHIYSYFYMSLDPYFRKFMVYLTLFTFFMLFFVSASSLVQLFFGWEGVGIFSYLLINFWYTRPQANKSALKAILVNRVGDCGLMFATILIMVCLGSADLHTIFIELPFISNKVTTIFGILDVTTVDILCFLIFLGVMSKSAQLGLHVWLPDAMEGPTPVSALIHAATMVTAGIYLFIRTIPFFESSPTVTTFALVIGGLTALFAASVALVQHDLKKVIAYSTCSQLGYMVMACATLQPCLSFFHLVNHAYFKALLFLGAGVVIHCMGGEQDIRKLGGLRQMFPIAFAAMFIAASALAGFPFLSGFYSKDVIISLLLLGNTTLENTIWLFSVVAAVFTSLYSFNLLFYVFLGNPRFNFWTYRVAHKASLLANLPLIPLTLLSISSGYMLRDVLIGFGSESNATFLQMYAQAPNNLELVEFIPAGYKLLSVFAAISGILYICYSEFYGIAPFTGVYFTNWESFYIFYARRWYWDRLYNFFIVWPTYRGSLTLVYRLFEKGTIEYISYIGVVNSFGTASKRIGQFVNGSLHEHILWTIFSFTTIALLFAVGAAI